MCCLGHNLQVQVSRSSRAYLSHFVMAAAATCIAFGPPSSADFPFSCFSSSFYIFLCFSVFIFFSTAPYPSLSYSSPLYFLLFCFYTSFSPSSFPYFSPTEFCLFILPIFLFFFEFLVSFLFFCLSFLYLSLSSFFSFPSRTIYLPILLLTNFLCLTAIPLFFHPLLLLLFLVFLFLSVNETLLQWPTF
jgi:hypothetical protein